MVGSPGSSSIRLFSSFDAAIHLGSQSKIRFQMDYIHLEFVYRKPKHRDTLCIDVEACFSRVQDCHHQRLRYLPKNFDREESQGRGHKKDREDFLSRLGRLLPETGTAGYSWSFLTNHACFLFPYPFPFKLILAVLSLFFSRKIKTIDPVVLSNVYSDK